MNGLLPNLECENLKDMLNVMLYTSQSFMTITPLLYYITYDKEILFIHRHRRWNCCLNEKPNKKFGELDKMTGEFNFASGVGLIKSTLRFPIDALGTV